MRVLLADGHPDVRWALRTFLADELAHARIAEAADISALMSAAENLGPDLILVDWQLPGWDGTAHLAALHSLPSPIGIIVLCTCPQIEQEVIAAGADAFVSKAGSPEQLLAALRALNWSELARGGHWT